jgi:hypothetical protein
MHEVFHKISHKNCVFEKSLKTPISKKGENDHSSGNMALIQKINTLYFLQLLKLDKRKCLHFVD